MASRYAIGRPDWLSSFWDYMVRSLKPGWEKRDAKGTWKIPPATIPLLTSPTARGNKERFALPPGHVRYLQDLNGGSKAKEYKAVVRPASGYVNVANNPGRVTPETLGWAGNFFELVGPLDLSKSAVQVAAFHFRGRAPDAALWNYELHPELVHKVTAINPRRGYNNLGAGYDAYTPLLGRGPLYVGLERIELFPELPLKVTVSHADGLNVRGAPSTRGNRPLRSLQRGTRVLVEEYMLRGPHVWGRIGERDYIALRWAPGNTAYHFTAEFRLLSPPPVHPRRRIL